MCMEDVVTDRLSPQETVASAALGAGTVPCFYAVAGRLMLERELRPLSEITGGKRKLYRMRNYITAFDEVNCLEYEFEHMPKAAGHRQPNVLCAEPELFLRAVSASCNGATSRIMPGWSVRKFLRAELWNLAIMCGVSPDAAVHAVRAVKVTRCDRAGEDSCTLLPEN